MSDNTYPLAFMEIFTRKMMETFQELHQLCLQQNAGREANTNGNPINSLANSQTLSNTIKYPANYSKTSTKVSSNPSTNSSTNPSLNTSTNTSTNNSNRSLNLPNNKGLTKTPQVAEGQSQLEQSQNYISNPHLSNSHYPYSQPQSHMQPLQPPVQANQHKHQPPVSKKKKPISHKPKAPTSSFLLFFKSQQAQIAKEYPHLGVTELTKVAASCWNQLSEEEKMPYAKICEEERKVYQISMEKYRLEYPEEIQQSKKEKILKKNKQGKQGKQSKQFNTTSKYQKKKKQKNKDSDYQRKLKLPPKISKIKQKKEPIDMEKSVDKIFNTGRQQGTMGTMGTMGGMGTIQGTMGSMGGIAINNPSLIPHSVPISKQQVIAPPNLNENQNKINELNGLINPNGLIELNEVNLDVNNRPDMSNKDQQVCIREGGIRIEPVFQKDNFQRIDLDEDSLGVDI